uniref:Uncharacterized protein n=1 Tax=Anguilla anguilla TaxID=7936 RepID=A0A0E9W4K2_ANGAN
MYILAYKVDSTNAFKLYNLCPDTNSFRFINN